MTAPDDLRIRPPHGPTEFPRLVEIWRSAIDATHGFLATTDREEIQGRLIGEYIPQVDLLVAEQAGTAVGFAGVAGQQLAMLFVDARYHRTGIGSALLTEAISRYGVTSVDANEQNPGALAFYRRHGFDVIGRSDVDGEGRPYPLLHLRRRDLG